MRFHTRVLYIGLIFILLLSMQLTFIFSTVHDLYLELDKGGCIGEPGAVQTYYGNGTVLNDSEFSVKIYDGPADFLDVLLEYKVSKTSQPVDFTQESRYYYIISTFNDSQFGNREGTLELYDCSRFDIIPYFNYSILINDSLNISLRTINESDNLTIFSIQNETFKNIDNSYEINYYIVNSTLGSNLTNISFSSTKQSWHYYENNWENITQDYEIDEYISENVMIAILTNISIIDNLSTNQSQELLNESNSNVENQSNNESSSENSQATTSTSTSTAPQNLNQEVSQEVSNTDLNQQNNNENSNNPSSQPLVDSNLNTNTSSSNNSNSTLYLIIGISSVLLIMFVVGFFVYKGGNKSQKKNSNKNAPTLNKESGNGDNILTIKIKTFRDIHRQDLTDDQIANHFLRAGFSKEEIIDAFKLIQKQK